MRCRRIRVRGLRSPAVHVVVVGCGRVGSSLARRLTAESHSVAIIDKRSQSFDRFLLDWPGTKIVGYGFDRDRLSEAGIERADALAAVTSGDNSNIIVARIAKETYQVANVMARIYDPRRATVYERLGIATVATVEWTADQAMRRITPDVTRAEWVHRTAGLAVVERGLPVSRVGKPLGGLEQDGPLAAGRPHPPGQGVRADAGHHRPGGRRRAPVRRRRPAQRARRRSCPVRLREATDAGRGGRCRQRRHQHGE